MKEHEEIDTSFSGVVNAVQGDTKIAKEMLIELANKKRGVEAEIKALEEKVASLQITSLMTTEGINNIIKHIKRPLPLAVVTEDELLVITEKGITFEKNVL